MAKASIAPRNARPANLLYDIDLSEDLVCISLKVPTSLAAQLEQILRHPAISNGRAGVLRYSIHLGLSKIADDLKESRIADELKLMLSISNRRRRQKLMGSFELNILEMKETVRGYIEKGMVEAAREEWEEAYETVAGMKDEHWKAKFLEILMGEEFAAVHPQPKKPTKPQLVKK